jgi:hypothetical protein
MFDKFIIDITQAFSSVTIPPIIKTVVRNGRTLVYRIQDSSTEEIKSAQSQLASVRRCDTTTIANPSISSAWRQHFGFHEIEIKDPCSTCAW